MDNEIKGINIDQKVWIIFIILAITNIYGDSLEKKELESNNYHSLKAKKIFILTASIFIIIYIYFAITNYKELEKHQDNYEEYNLYKIRLTGNILIILGSLFLIYFRIKENKPYSPDLL